ncbi:septal ring lytic transglycosylase RlpA family protein [Paraburkholderia sp. A1RI_3L]|uniref:septal ring lytic transglycosylase RlpA family protein n=1 Tax=Paraburkholderia TaxID=1822464 RepID=UPI000477B32F|nr:MULTISPECIES: septal ring lytic transglycosylase RlpA family protein [Paraburkholderia]WEY38913.1 septal ring lytic transglycosylase RlpA family protein [Paraburkholderia sp. SUR17]
MKSGRSRQFGSLVAFAILTGCAMPPGPATQANNGTPVRTDARNGTQSTAPQSFGAAFDHNIAASDASAGKSSLADAEPLTDGPNVSNFRQTGRASWYGRFFHGRRTASGERYDMHALTAAHRTLPLGSYVRVSLPGTSKFVVVKINDRGPYMRGRVIDLSFAAAKVLGVQNAGTARVQIEGLTQQEAREARAEMLAENAPNR